MPLKPATQEGLSLATTRNEDQRIKTGNSTIEVVPAWRYLLDLPESTA